MRERTLRLAQSRCYEMAVRARPLAFFVCLVAGAALAQEVAGPQVPTASGVAMARGEVKDLRGYDPNGGAGKKVYSVPIEGTIDLGLAPLVERVAREATANDVVFLQIKTFGGRVDGAVRIRDALLATKAKTIAFIDQRAISAGALISLACDTIIMTPGASLGAATPIQQGGEGGGESNVTTNEKIISYMRAEMRATAEAKGRRGDIAEAMVDPDIAVDGVDEKGKLLTLTADKAFELGFIDAKASTADDALRLLNLLGADRVVRDADWGERVARWLTEPTISSLLMTFGVLGLLMELYTPGLGLGGLVGFLCLALFFFGQYAAHLAGWEEMILFAVGLVLIVLELLVIPGHGIAGVTGFIIVVAALVMAMIELRIPLEVSFELGYAQQMIQSALLRVGVALVALFAGLVFLVKYGPRSAVGKMLILDSATSDAKGYLAAAPEQATYVGKKGRVIHTLRPAGTIELDGKRIDVVSNGEFIQVGSFVRVTQVDGNRIVVEKLEIPGAA